MQLAFVPSFGYPLLEFTTRSGVLGLRKMLRPFVAAWINEAEGVPALWGVEARGHYIDLELLEKILDESRVRRLETPPGSNLERSWSEKETFLIVTIHERKRLTPWGVAEVATDLFQRLSGLLFSVDPERLPIYPGELFELDDDGSLIAGYIVGDDPTTAPAITSRYYTDSAMAILDRAGAIVSMHEGWLQLSETNDVVSDTFCLLSGDTTWFDLYKAYERMRSDLDQELGPGNYESLGWPSRRAIGHFTRSAQLHRHAQVNGAYSGTFHPMGLRDARLFVSDLLRLWLTWHYSRFDLQTTWKS